MHWGFLVSTERASRGLNGWKNRYHQTSRPVVISHSGVAAKVITPHIQGNTAECRSNAVQFITILQTALRWQQQNVNQTWNLQQTPHTSPSWATYEVAIMISLNKLERVITAPHTGEFPTQRPVMQSFDVFFDLRMNKRLSKPSRRRWFETLSRSLWRQSNEYVIVCCNIACYKEVHCVNGRIVFPVIMAITHCRVPTGSGKPGKPGKLKFSGKIKELWKVMEKSWNSHR